MRRSTALAAALATALAPCAGWADEPASAAAPTDLAAPPDAAAPRNVTAPSDVTAPGDVTAPAPAATASLPGLRRPLPLLGVSVGGGFPDLVNANLLVRPLPWLRLYGGPCWSSISWGAQAGVLVAPWASVVTPTLSLQTGKVWGTSLRRYVKSNSTTAQELKPLLGNVEYQYLAGDLGLEVGSPRGFSFYLRLGLSLVSITANGSATHTAGDGTRVTIRDPSVTAWLPSAKLGFQYWF
jgi:hypothetical protein